MGKNFEYNQQAFVQCEAAMGNKSLYSRDGFLEYQHGLELVKFGETTAAYAGCGAIATWNILKFLGENIEIACVFDEMEKGLLFGGKLGMRNTFLRKYLKQKGYNVNTCASDKIIKAAATPRQGVLYYMKSNFRAHYVAFTPAGVNENGEALFRFHNAGVGQYWKMYTSDKKKHIENIPLTMDEFLKASKAMIKVWHYVYA